MPLSPGQTLSHFRVVRKIGAGGMGVVFLARDEHLDRDVALKVLPAGSLADAESHRRFRTEALALSRLSHPNIAVVHDFDIEDGLDFLVMEYVPGTTLRDRVASDRFDETEIRDIARQLAAALVAAHDQGILHRDLKPGNLLLQPDGRLKVLDFGLARLLRTAADPAREVTITAAGHFLGTPAYMSPEQLKGEPADERSDIYAAGAVLYELATGCRPHPESSPALLVDAVLNHRPTPPRERRPELSPELDRIIMKALATDPRQRHGSARELQRALEALSAPGGTDERLETVDERPKIVVLPMENLGHPEHDYFAAGLTEEIASRLAIAGGLAVISRTSALRYAKSGKTVRQIGEELGVSHVLEGTVRWAPRTGGGDQVRICTELVRVSDETQTWVETYDRVIDDIFSVQTDISRNVVRALGVTLGERSRRRIESRLTSSPPAYHAYLRGRYLASQPHFSVEVWRDVISHYEEAVRLDPGFVQAWAELARAHARFYCLKADLSRTRRELASGALARAVSLAPSMPEVRLAQAYFHLWVDRDEERALEDLAVAEGAHPDEAEILRARVNYLETRGRWKEAGDVCARAFELSPRDADLATELILIEWVTRRYESAESYCDTALALAPDTGYRVWPNLYRAFIHWSRSGGTAAGRAAIEQVPSEHEWAAWARFWQTMYEGRFRQALASVSSEREAWVSNKLWAMPMPLLAAFAHDALGESGEARTAYAAAQAVLIAEVEAQPDDPRFHSSLGLACAGLGLADRAIEAGRRATELLPLAKDGFYGIAPLQDLSMIDAKVGAVDEAVEVIEQLMSVPSWLTPAWLRVDPRYRPLAESARFQELLRSSINPSARS